MDKQIVHGPLHLLWQKYGEEVLPVRSEGLIHMYWRQHFKGTPRESWLEKQREFSPPPMAPLVEERIYIHGELETPTANGAVFVAGQYPTGDEIVESGKRYCLCRAALSDRQIEVPLSVKYEFFSRNVLPIVGRLYETATYVHGSFEYSAQFHQRHVEAMSLLLSNIPSDQTFVEPGCGAGVVLSLRPGVVKAGDLYPPKGASIVIQKETISETLRRGSEGDIYVCAYISHFLTEEDYSYLSTKKVIWIDSPSKVIPAQLGKNVYPGVNFYNIPPQWYPSKFIMEKQIVSVPLQYTENLLNGSSYVVLSENESVRYLRAQRPHIPLVYHKVYQGQFRSQHVKGDRVFAATVEEALMCLKLLQRPAYFAPVGREITKVFTEANVLVVNHGTQVYYEHRQLYSIPATDKYLCSLFKGLPSKEISGRFYFYDPKESLDPRPIHYVTQTSLVVGTLHPKIGMDKPVGVDIKSVNHHRIYLTINDIRIPLRWDGSYTSLLQLFRTAFPSSIDGQILTQILDSYEEMGGQYRTTSRAAMEQVKQWAKWLAMEVG